MTVQNRFGETVRGFQVVVARPDRRTNLRYPASTGEAALSLMATMKARGRATMAETSSPYSIECLTLAEMRKMFGRANQ